MAKNFAGRVAIITGGGRGIGRATALSLAQQGATVIICDNGVKIDGSGGSKEPAQSTVDEITRAGGVARANFGSVTDWNTVQALVEDTVKEFGHIDILVNTVALSDATPIWELTKEHFDRIVDASVDGTFNCIRHVAPHMMKQRYGRIVNFLSRGGLNALASVSAYAVAKAGVYGLTNSVSCDLEPYGIMVNGVFPGAAKTRMVTEILESTTDPDLIERRDALLKVMQTPENVAAMVVYLCSDACHFAGEYFLVEGNGIGRYAPLNPAMHTKKTDGLWNDATIAQALSALGVAAPKKSSSRLVRG